MSRSLKLDKGFARDIESKIEETDISVKDTTDINHQKNKNQMLSWIKSKHDSLLI
jgi:hypothetical protein